MQRPTLVADWREGRDTDGAGEPLDADLSWQAELWRRLLQRVDDDPPDVRHARVLERLRAGGDGLALPDRLSLFGHTRLPVTEIALLQALGEHRDVHLWLPQPSASLWDDLADLGGVVPRDDDHSADLVAHPLLASLGRDTRELRRLLADVPSSATAVDVAEPDSLLGWLQHDLRANHAPTVEERAGRRVRDDDRSLQVHACHSAARQVDVLREVLVGLLDDDPTLEPRDILVMCPDIETFAPLISAGFGLADVVEDADGGGHPAHRLRVRLADRALSSTNPLLAVAATLVELAGGRVTASDVLDLATQEACRLRFGFSDDDLARVTRWVAQAGIRWGIDGPSRAPFAMADFDHNTWRSGLDRILLGVAMSGDDHHHLGRGLPVDDVASSDIDLVGRLAEYTARLADCLAAMTAAGTVQEWVDALGEGVRSLTEVPADDAWQLTQFERELARAGVSSASDPGVPLRLADVRALLQSRLGGRPTRANFRTGTLTVCTMVPMRSVPHRVVCLVGLDDGVFPRTTSVDGDDVLARRPLTGERDARSEDRQLLLDALLAAVDTVVITYTGANEHTGAERPPAVPLGEILDATDRTTATAVRDRVLVRHPLQPYDVRNLEPGRLVGERPFSFDRAALAGAVAAAGPRTPPLRCSTERSRRDRPEDVSLADLKAFLTHPVRAFLRGRLDVSTPFEPDELSDAIPVGLDALEVWQVGDRLLREVLAGQDPVAVMTAEQLRGTLPPGVLGRRALAGVTEECQKLFTRTADLREGEPRSIDVDVDLGDGRRLTGTVARVHGTKVVSLGYSRLKPRQRLLAWLDLLALSAALPRRELDLPRRRPGAGRSAAGPGRSARPPRASSGCATWSHCATRGSTGRCRCRWPLPRPGRRRTPASCRARTATRSAPPAGRGRPTRTTTTGSSARTPTPTTSGSTATPLRSSGSLDDGLPAYAWRIWEPLLTGAERVGPL